MGTPPPGYRNYSVLLPVARILEMMLAAFRSGYESVSLWPEDHEGQLETLIMGRMLLLANYIAVSEDSEDRAFAPEYLSRCEGRLRAFLDDVQ